MDPIRIYDYLCHSRAIVLDRIRTISAAQYTHPFPIGPGSLARTLAHIVVSEWYYTQRMLAREVPPYETWWINENEPPPFAVLESEWTSQADATRRALGAIRTWDAPVQYRVTTDAGVRTLVTCTPMDLFTQLAFHEVHHRAQVLNMLRTLGITIDRDIDFNAMMYTREAIAD